MSLAKLRRQMEERRLILVNTLQKGKGTLELSKQHQLYGAIKELEHALKAIDTLREETARTVDFELKREGPPALSTRMGDALKNVGERTIILVSNVGKGIHRTFFHGTKRTIKRIHARIKIYREVMREVKRRNREEF